MRLLISGSRNYNDYEAFKDNILKYYHDTERKTGSHRIDCIISGGARGTDTMAERFADEYNIPKEIYPADWNKYGRSAGPIRNRQMLKEGRIGEVVCFMAKDSRGTADMLQAAIEAGKPAKVIHI
jgi:SLOG family YspA-like protein